MSLSLFVWCVFMAGVRLDIWGRNTTIKKKKKKRMLCPQCILSKDV